MRAGYGELFAEACGIYVIQNDVTGRLYLGSSVNLRRRHMRHVRELRGGSHHNRPLQMDWNKYGEQSFSFRSVCISEPAGLLQDETDMLASMVGHPDCYNICADAFAPNRGRRLTQEHKRKIGQANAVALKGNCPSPEARRNQSAAQIGILKGRKLTDAHRAKLRAAKLGKPAPWNAKPKSAETKSKISETVRRQYANGRRPHNKKLENG